MLLDQWFPTWGNKMINGKGKKFILEDFSLIFEFFVKYFSKEMDAKSQKKFGTTALDVLKTFPFQSNVASF